jgi:DNA-binding GntR family transcriptional regulator
MENLSITPPAAAPVREQVVDTLRRAIASRQFIPGQRLVERELCELLGVSRTPVREALRQLETEGFVRTIANRGVVVSTISPSEAASLYEIREALEGLAARLCAERAQAADLADLRSTVVVVEAARDADDLIGFLDGAKAFYVALLRGARNPLAESMLTSLHARIDALRATSLSQPGRPAGSAAGLAEIAEAVEAKDPQWAEEAARRHVRNAGKTAIAALIREVEAEGHFEHQ